MSTLEKDEQKEEAYSLPESGRLHCPLNCPVCPIILQQGLGSPGGDLCPELAHSHHQGRKGTAFLRAAMHIILVISKGKHKS